MTQQEVETLMKTSKSEAECKSVEQRINEALWPLNQTKLKTAFESRDAIDKSFNRGDTVCVVGVPEAVGVVVCVVGDMARVTGIPAFSSISFDGLEHAPDPDGVTRYHTKDGEVFAECGVSTEPEKTDRELVLEEALRQIVCSFDLDRIRELAVEALGLGDWGAIK